MMVDSPVRPALRYIYLRLSQTPPPLWESYFKESRKVSRHPHWRRAWIDRKYVIVECLPEEVEKYHLNDLKQDIAYANQHYRQYSQRQNQAKIKKKENDLQERERLREIKSRLNFD